MGCLPKGAAHGRSPSPTRRSVDESRPAPAEFRVRRSARGRGLHAGAEIAQPKLVQRRRRPRTRRTHRPGVRVTRGTAPRNDGPVPEGRPCRKDGRASAGPSERPGHPSDRAIRATGPSERPGHPSDRAIRATGPAGESGRAGRRERPGWGRAPGARSRSHRDQQARPDPLEVRAALAIELTCRCQDYISETLSRDKTSTLSRHNA
jgi:hypothetical protein